MLYSHDTTIQIYRCREKRSIDDSRYSGTKRLFTSWLLVFRHEERERENFYSADCFYIAHSQLPSWTGPAQRQVSTNCFFQKSPNSQPIASVHMIVSFPIWRFYYDICDCHILFARAWTILNVCAFALSQIVQGPTKPNDKI